MVSPEGEGEPAEGESLHSAKHAPRRRRGRLLFEPEPRSVPEDIDMQDAPGRIPSAPGVGLKSSMPLADLVSGASPQGATLPSGGAFCTTTESEGQGDEH